MERTTNNLKWPYIIKYPDFDRWTAKLSKQPLFSFPKVDSS